MYLSLRVRMYIYIYTHVCVGVYVCTYIYVCVCYVCVRTLVWCFLQEFYQHRSFMDEFVIVSQAP